LWVEKSNDETTYELAAAKIKPEQLKKTFVPELNSFLP